MAGKSKKTDENSLATQTLVLKFNRKDFALIEKGSNTRIILKKSIVRGEEGFPALPAKKIYAIIPAASRIGSLSPSIVKKIKVADNIVIEPLQPNVPAVLGAIVRPAEPRREVYGSDGFWPRTAAKLLQSKRSATGTLIEIEVCPFRFYPQEKKLEFIEEMTVTVGYEPIEVSDVKSKSANNLRYIKRAGEKLKKLVVNPELVSVLERKYSLDDILDFTIYPQVDYVIITSNALAAKFQRLAEWRNTFGLCSRVVTVENILAGTVPDTGAAQFNLASGYTDGGTRDIPEVIRNFTKWAAANWLTSYVLLGGDTEIIPVRKALHTGVGRIPYGDINNPDTNVQLAVSAAASTQKAANPAANVLDKDAATAWECEASDNAPYIMLNVGAHTPVNRVDLTWGALFASSYIVQVSSDGTTWSDVYNHSSGNGGFESITFNCVSASQVRVKITSGTVFSLLSVSVYGPAKRGWDGMAYQMNDTVTRVYLSHWMQPNPANDIEENLIIIMDGPYAGKIIPYNQASNDTNLGWHFVQDLVNMPGTVSANSTKFIEICGPAEYHDHTYAIKDEYNYIPADLYYADVALAEYPESANHDWDADNNGVYGERYGSEVDAVNSIPDLLIGRASVESAADVDNFIDKIMRYERYMCKDEFGLDMIMPLDFSVSVLLGSQNFGTNIAGSLDGSAAGKEDIRHMLRDIDPARWLLTRLYEDYADVPSADQGSDLAVASTAAIMSSISANQNIVALSSHGSPGYLCYLVNNNVDNVVNYPGIWYGNSCLTNKIDTTPGESFGETTMRNTVGGAVAYTGNTRFGWTGDGYIEKAFWEEMLDSGVLGEMFQTAKIICHDWEKYSLNLLGDPAMRVWNDRPRQLTVTHSSLIYTGNQSFQVNVSSDGSPVAGAVVCCSMTGSMFAKGITDTSGKVILAINPSAAGIMKVAVSGKNLIPYLGAVTVKKSEGGSTCTTLIYCGNKIVCGNKITTCGVKIVCGAKITCGRNIGICGIKIDPGFDHGCPVIRPDDWDIFEQLFEIWGIRNAEEFARMSKSPEYAEKIDRLPSAMRKSVNMMIEHILKEKADNE